MTRAEEKLIRALKSSRQRKKKNLFIVEGDKDVKEVLLSNFELKHLFSTSEWRESLVENSEIDLKDTWSELNTKLSGELSSYENSDGPIAICSIPDANRTTIFPDTVLIYDRIRDPGNLGTIIRTADWFNISSIFCSSNSVDVYNPKVLSASKGSFTRITVNYVELTELIGNLKKLGYSIYGTTLSGTPLQKLDTTQQKKVFLFGNESQGLSDDLLELCDDLVSIEKKGRAESLNLAMSSAIFMYHCS